MAFHDLRTFLSHLEASGQLRRVDEPVATELESTALCLRALRAEGPALLFEQPGSSSHALLGNLFGHRSRIEAALAGRPLASLRELGELLAAVKEPRWPGSLREALAAWPEFAQLAHVAPRRVPDAAFRDEVLTGDDVDLTRLPIQRCWPGRRRAADHHGHGGHARHATRTTERRHLPAAGPRPQSRDHALAAAPRRRARLRRLARGASRPTRSRCWSRSAPTRRRCWPPWRRCPTRSPSTNSPACCAASARGSGAATSPGSMRRPAPRSCSRDSSIRATRRSRDRSATTPATTTRRASSRC